MLRLIYYRLATQFTFTPMSNLDLPVNLTPPTECGRKLEHPQRIEQADSTQKGESYDKTMQTKCAHHHLQHSVMSYSILKQKITLIKITVYAVTLVNAKPKYEKLGGTVKPKLCI